MSEAKEKLAGVIDALGLSITSEFIPFSQSRNRHEKQPSLNWRVSLLRNGRHILTTDYSAGCAHCPAYKREWAGGNRHVKARAIALECKTGKKAKPGFGQGEPYQSRQDILPDSVDVIWSLSRDCDVLDYPCFEDWALDFGYDPDSRKAEKTYQDCLAIALQFRAAIGEDGLAALREAGEDY